MKGAYNIVKDFFFKLFFEKRKRKKLVDAKYLNKVPLDFILNLNLIFKAIPYSVRDTEKSF